AAAADVQNRARVRHSQLVQPQSVSAAWVRFIARTNRLPSNPPGFRTWREIHGNTRTISTKRSIPNVEGGTYEPSRGSLYFPAAVRGRSKREGSIGWLKRISEKVYLVLSLVLLLVVWNGILTPSMSR